MTGFHTTIIAILGNARLNQAYLVVFLEYFVPTALVVTVMLTRLKLLELMALFVDEIRRRIGRERREAIMQHDLASAHWWRRMGNRIHQLENWMYRKIQEVSAQQIVFFTRGDSLGNLNRVMQYIEDNEHTDRVKIVTVVPKDEPAPPKLEEHLKFLDEAYPHIDIEFVKVEGQFSPALIRSLSTQWGIPMNLMFVGSPGEDFMYGISELGGVRLII